jgi:hypothetical protein
MRKCALLTYVPLYGPSNIGKQEERRGGTQMPELGINGLCESMHMNVVSSHYNIMQHTLGREF